MKSFSDQLLSEVCIPKYAHDLFCSVAAAMGICQIGKV